MSKVLGIIGGMGPLATAQLFTDVVLNTKANKDQDHIHILIDNNTQIPSRPEYILDNTKEDPRDQLILSGKRLEDMGAEFLAMPCNTAHYFYEDIKNEVNIPFINMIEETMNYIRAEYPQVKKIGILSTVGTIKAKIYDQVFDMASIEIINPSEVYQSHVNDLIAGVKAGKNFDDLNDFMDTIGHLKDFGAQLFIAGCTEISVALKTYDIKGDFVDPMDVLTKSIIHFAGKEIID